MTKLSFIAIAENHLGVKSDVKVTLIEHQGQCSKIEIEPFSEEFKIEYGTIIARIWQNIQEAYNSVMKGKIQ